MENLKMQGHPALESHAEAGMLPVGQVKSFEGRRGTVPNRGTFPTMEDMYQAMHLGLPADEDVVGSMLESARPYPGGRKMERGQEYSV